MSPKVAPDQLPGEYAKRVFIGGNYDNIVVLREFVKAAVTEVAAEIGLELFPLLPRDDVAVPLHDIHDTDLRILHNCRYAIFDVSVPGGEMMEVERTREYGTQALLVYQDRNGAPAHITSMIRTVKIPLKGYRTKDDLKVIIREFFSAPLDPDMGHYLRIVGYSFDRISTFETVDRSGLATETTRFEGLRARGEKPVTRLSAQRWELTHGEILRVESNVIDKGPGDVKVELSGDSKNREAKVTIEPPLTAAKDMVSFELVVKTRGVYALTKEEFKAISPDDPNIIEWIGRTITHPTDEQILGISFFDGYEFQPRVAVFYGTYQDVDAPTSPMVSFTRPNPWSAQLHVKWPKPGHRYTIMWEPLDKLEGR